MAAYLGYSGCNYTVPWWFQTGWYPFCNCLLVGSTINGLTILIALLIRYILVKKNKENEQTLNILGAGSLAGAALYSFFTATLSLGKKK